MALFCARICKPTSKLVTLSLFARTTMGIELGPVSANELYEAMDWLLEQQPSIKKQLARTHEGSEHDPGLLWIFRQRS